MKIDAIKPNNINFQKIIFADEKLLKSVMQSCSNSQLVELERILASQKNNPVDAVIFPAKNRTLKGKIMCQYRIPDFKEYYKQRLCEPKLWFLKRLANKLDEYKQYCQ